MRRNNQNSATDRFLKFLHTLVALSLFCIVSGVGAMEPKAAEEDTKATAPNVTHGQKMPIVNNYTNTPEELLVIFNEAVTLHQRALELSDPEMLKEAEQLYLTYLDSEPNACAVANNLAKLYEELGQSDKAIEYYEIAIKSEDPRQQQYLENYAKFLDGREKNWGIANKSNDPRQQQYLENYANFLDGTEKNWAQASQVYSQLVKTYSISKNKQAELAELYSEKGLDAYIGFMWELIETGGSLDIATLALDSFAGKSGASDADRMELLAITTAGLGHWAFNESQYVESGLQAQLLAGSNDPVIGGGLSGIARLYDLTLKVQSTQGRTASGQSVDCMVESLCQQFEPGRFPWWSNLAAHDQEPARGIWPADGFRALIRSLGEQIAQIATEYADQEALSKEYFQFAKSYFSLAANLQVSMVDPAAVQELIRIELETASKPDVTQVRLQYEDKLVKGSGDILESEGAFEYHKLLADYYSYLNDRGDATAAKSVVYQLQQAKRRSEDQPACALADDDGVSGEHCFTDEMQLMLDQACIAAGTCQQELPPLPEPDTEYVGDNIRVGIGYTSETDLTGEFFWSFLEDADSATSIEGWKGQDSSGGLKLNFHWVSGGVPAGTDEAGKPFYSEGKVRKLFVAADQNIFSDAKVTFGGGSEHDDTFWSLYGSKSVSGERAVGQTINVEQLVKQLFEDNHQITQTDTWTTTTDFMAHPYEWGVGFRVGRYYNDSLLRLRGGFDYEDGDFSSYQLTGYASLDKRFKDSSQGLSFRAEVVRKQGDFETDKSDVRVSAFWSWEFGTSFRESVAYENVPVKRSLHGSDLPSEQLTGVVPTEESIPFDEASNFKINRYDLTEAAKKALEKNIAYLGQAKGKILITGHTCSLGSDDFNQKLSQKRAETVAAYLIERDLDATVLCTLGRGEAEPRFSNDTEESRQKNRRVEISFVIDKATTLTSTAIDGTYDGWEQRPVPAEATWIRRALRNPVSHKRTVDYYSYNRVAEQLTTVTELKNSGANAEGDDFTVNQDSMANPLDILANDSDPENDNLRIIAVSTPAHGTATINGDSVLYTPNTGYSGPDSFTYEIEDIYVTAPHPPGESSTAMVSITVLPSNRPPVAMDDQLEAAKNSHDNQIDVLANDSDPDGDQVSIIGVGTASNGTVTYTESLVFYTPNPEFIGEDHFEYTIEDGNGGEDTAWVTVNVIYTNSPPVAVDDITETWKNIRVTIDVLANDYDPDGDPITIVDIIQDEHPMGTVTDNGDGTLTYLPMKGWFGGDQFQYTISDGELTSTATVTINVKGIPR